MRMKVKRFLTSVNASNCYIAWCPETREGAIIDPAEFTDEMRETIERERIALKAAYITHGHYDHDGALGEVAEPRTGLASSRRSPRSSRKSSAFRAKRCSIPATAPRRPSP